MLGCLKRGGLILPLPLTTPLSPSAPPPSSPLTGGTLFELEASGANSFGGVSSFSFSSAMASEILRRGPSRLEDGKEVNV